jgi:hypothetical protein
VNRHLLLLVVILILALGEFNWVLKPSWGRRWLRLYWDLRGWIFAPIPFVLDTLLIALCRSRTLHGIRVSVLDRRKAEHSWRQVDEALEIVGRFDARRLRSLRSDLARIVVAPTKRTYFSPYTRTCFLDVRTVDDYGNTDIAVDLVHEAIHGRLRRRGLTAYGADLSERVEQLCIDEQIAFTKRLALAPDQTSGLDNLLLFLEHGRRTHPPTQAWPRTTPDPAHHKNSILLAVALLLLTLDWWVPLPDLVGIAATTVGLGLCVVVVGRAWKLRTF